MQHTQLCFHSWYRIIRTGEDKAEHSVPHPMAHPMPWLSVCPTTKPGVRKVEPKDEQVLVTQEKKTSQQPTNQQSALCREMKLPSQPTVKPSCLYQLLFWVKFFTVSTGHGEILPLFISMPRVLSCWHTAAMSHPTPGCGRGQRNSSPPQVSIMQSVLGSLSLSRLEVCTVGLFLLVLLMSNWGKGAWKAQKLLFSIYWWTSSKILWEKLTATLSLS